jgi:hypothetical protein
MHQDGTEPGRQLLHRDSNSGGQQSLGHGAWSSLSRAAWLIAVDHGVSSVGTGAWSSNNRSGRLQQSMYWSLHQEVTEPGHLTFSSVIYVAEAGHRVNGLLGGGSRHSVGHGAWSSTGIQSLRR